MGNADGHDGGHGHGCGDGAVCDGAAHDEMLSAITREILESVRGLDYGAVTVTFQAGRMVQLERTEKRRLPSLADS